MELKFQAHGIGKVQAEIKRRMNLAGEGVAAGLKRAGLQLQHLSQEVVPIDTGTLKNSAFTSSSGKGEATVVKVGYTTGYAVYVHENLDARHKEGKQAKYLEQPFREHKDELLAIVAESARKKMR